VQSTIIHGLGPDHSELHEGRFEKFPFFSTPHSSQRPILLNPRSLPGSAASEGLCHISNS
jgi:hypothetical protein